MSTIKVGDIVARISHGMDILFKVEEIIEHRGKAVALLRGLDLRLYADSPVADLEKKTPSEISAYRQAYIKQNSDMMKRIFQRRMQDREYFLSRGSTEKPVAVEHFEIPGTVLHLDGDKEYLDLCKTTYSQLSIKAYGFHVPENKQAEQVVKYLIEYTPDILVMTGHDGIIKDRKDFSDINNYRYSKHFVQAVRRAREYEPGRDDLVIFAGACQSHYEALIEAGANFASSPQRVLIHAFDPVFIVEKIAYSSISEVLSLKDIINNTITGIEGVGGIESRGRFRMGYPKSPY
ncbi:MAG: peptidase [Peptococcaceae bacterium BICA1-8]|nr:MAG: peptidase [Peptococcaceae bacterium BICA1-8]